MDLFKGYALGIGMGLFLALLLAGIADYRLDAKLSAARVEVSDLERKAQNLRTENTSLRKKLEGRYVKHAQHSI